MMEENNDIFLADGDALVTWPVQYTKNIPQHLFEAIHLVRRYLRIGFSTHPFPPPPIFKYMDAFRVTVIALGLFQKIILKTIAHMC